MISVGRRIRELRKRSGMTITELAHRVGISQPYLSQIERDDKSCPHDVLQRICDELGITLVEFFSEDGKEMSSFARRVLDMLQKLRPSQQEFIATMIEELSKTNDNEERRQ